MDHPKRKRQIEEFLDSMVGKPRRQMFRLVNNAIKKYKDDLIVLGFYMRFKQLLKEDKHMRIERIYDSEVGKA